MPVQLSFINPHRKPTCAPVWRRCLQKCAPERHKMKTEKRETLRSRSRVHTFHPLIGLTCCRSQGQIPSEVQPWSEKMWRIPWTWKKTKKKTAQGQFSGCFLETGSTRSDERFRGAAGVPALSAFCCVTFHRRRLQEIKLSISVFWWEDRKLSQTHSLPLS